MKSLDEIKSAIVAMMNEQFRNPDAFEDFAPTLIELGISRLFFDALTNSMSFYTATEFVHSLSMLTLVEALSKDTAQGSPWSLGKSLDTTKLKQFIHELDSRKIDHVEFHKRIFSAGVIACHVYLLKGKIYYMSADGEYYLEIIE